MGNQGRSNCSVPAVYLRAKAITLLRWGRLQLARFVSKSAAPDALALNDAPAAEAETRPLTWFNAVVNQTTLYLQNTWAAEPVRIHAAKT